LATSSTTPMPHKRRRIRRRHMSSLGLSHTLKKAYIMTQQGLHLHQTLGLKFGQISKKVKLFLLSRTAHQQWHQALEAIHCPSRRYLRRIRKDRWYRVHLSLNKKRPHHRNYSYVRNVGAENSRSLNNCSKFSLFNSVSIRYSGQSSALYFKCSPPFKILVS
jgi:hypothetical protein